MSKQIQISPRADLGSSSGSSSAAETLTAQWYNAVTTALSLSPQSFQLMQGYQAVGNQSEPLWQAFDAVPPQSVSHFFQPSGLVQFSTQYDAIIDSLVPPSSSAFETVMGQYYQAWTTASASRPPDETPEVYFQSWAESNIPDPSIATQAIADFDQMWTGTVPTALTMWSQMMGATTNAQIVAYTTTIDDVMTALANGPTVKASMDSATESSNVSKTWADGTVGGALGFFDGSGDGSMSDITEAIAKASLQLQVTFDHVLTVTAEPLSEPSTDPILSAYTPWYDSAALSLAYETKGSSVWNPTAQVTWDTAFGSDGSLLRASTGLVVVDGINLTITSTVELSSEQQQQVQAAVSAGFWPFFTSNASGGEFQNSVSFQDDTMTLTVSAPTGQPWLLGVIVTPIASLFGS